MARITEAQLSIATLQIAAKQHNGVATFHRLRKELPSYLSLSTADKAPSLTRHGEELWEQLIRNIKSHSDVPGNIIYEGYANHVPRVGYEVTELGKRYLARKKLI